MAVHLTIQRFKNLLCLFLYYPGRGCKHVFFFSPPQLHAAFIIPDEYFHKCKPLGRTGLKQKCEGNFLLILFHPGMAEFWVSRSRFLIFFLISLRKGSVKSDKLPLPQHCILGPAAGHFIPYLVIKKNRNKASRYY